jgi:hypothetical protein
MPEHVLPCKEKSAAVIPVRNELPNIFGGLTINSQSGSVLVLLLVIGKEMPHIIFFVRCEGMKGAAMKRLRLSVLRPSKKLACETRSTEER